MNTKGKVPATYKYKINGKLIGVGSMEEIAEELGVTKHAIWNRTQKTRKRIREGGNPRMIHELIVDKPSIHEYILMIDDEMVAKGTIKEISEETHYAYDYLLKLSNGNLKLKRRNMVLYKKC